MTVYLQFGQRGGPMSTQAAQCKKGLVVMPDGSLRAIQKTADGWDHVVYHGELVGVTYND